MILKALEVENYRNIPAARFEPGRELTVICGKNGQGKTNLLEAVWLLTGGKRIREKQRLRLLQIRNLRQFRYVIHQGLRNQKNGIRKQQQRHTNSLLLQKSQVSLILYNYFPCFAVRVITCRKLRHTPPFDFRCGQRKVQQVFPFLINHYKNSVQNVVKIYSAFPGNMI